MPLTASIASPITSLPIFPSGKGLKFKKNVLPGAVGHKPQSVHFPRIEKSISIKLDTRRKHTSVICHAARNVRCAAEGQTQTVTRQSPSSIITVAPTTPGKEKSPDLDDGGSGFPPRDDGGGGGGGGGGGHWSGGFFFFGLLAFLGMLKDKESEGPYRDEKRRR